MLTGIIAVVFVLALQPSSAVVLDRIAVVVGKRAIKSSDIDRDLRVTAFLNRVPIDTSTDSKHKAAERLIDQQIIRQEIATGDYPRAIDSDAEGLVGQIRTSRFAGSDARLKAELSRYGLTEAQLHEQLLWQLTVLRFINERFRPGAQVSEDDVKKYYDAHLAELKREYVRDNSFETLEPKIRETLEGDQTNKQFETWLNDSRKQIRIDYYQEALH